MSHPRFILSLCALFLAYCSQGQYNSDLGIRIGGASYLGEIGGSADARRDFVFDLKLSQTRESMGVFYRFKLHPKHRLYLNSGFSYGRIQGSDALSTNPGRAGRNLSFRNQLFEANSRIEWQVYQVQDVGNHGRYVADFSAYIFAGAAGFWHNPQAQFEGVWYDLRPLKTEGQNTPYSNFNVAIPLGAGFYFTLSKKIRVGFDVGWRQTFTDYLDDVSTTYADADALDNNPLSIALANRNVELDYSTGDFGAPENYTAGQKRGNPENNDGYLFSSFTLSYVFRGEPMQGQQILTNNRIKRKAWFPKLFKGKGYYESPYFKEQPQRKRKYNVRAKF